MRYALQNDDNEQVNNLIKQAEAATPLEGLFETTVCRHSTDAVNKLLQLSEDDLPQYRKDGLLTRACLTGNLDAAKALLDAGADTNGPKKPVLIVAAIHGCRDILELLIQRKADTSIVNSSGRSAIHELSRSNDRKLDYRVNKFCPCS